jgi:hypothetical protein
MYKLITRILTDYHVIVALFSVVISLKWANWKNWQQYYPTILFYITGNLIYSLLSYNYPLWEFESPLFKCTISNLLVTVVTAPALIMLYLPHMPKSISKQVLWIIFWVFILTSLEVVAYRLNSFSHHNNWTIGWSVLFNCVMFPLLWLHYKKPAWALLSSIVIASFIIIYFRIPFSSMK